MSPPGRPKGEYRSTQHEGSRVSRFATVARVECFVVTLPRDVPYLGPLGAGERVTERGYVVRQGNRTLYPTVDRSVLVKVTADDGTVGWGETYGIVAPGAVVAIVDDVLGPFVVGRDPRDVVVIQEDLYDLMRVRGCFGGFYVDAIAGIDIALWDLFGRLVGQPVVKLLGGQRTASVPAYVSGLRARRCATRWRSRSVLRRRDSTRSSTRRRCRRKASSRRCAHCARRSVPRPG